MTSRSRQHDYRMLVDKTRSRRRRENIRRRACRDESRVMAASPGRVRLVDRRARLAEGTPSVSRRSQHVPQQVEGPGGAARTCKVVAEGGIEAAANVKRQAELSRKPARHRDADVSGLAARGARRPRQQHLANSRTCACRSTGRGNIVRAHASWRNCRGIVLLVLRCRSETYSQDLGPAACAPPDAEARWRACLRGADALAQPWAPQSCPTHVPCGPASRGEHSSGRRGVLARRCVAGAAVRQGG